MKIITCRRNMKVMIHLKYLDDRIFAEAIVISKQIVALFDHQSPLSDNLHASTGYALSMSNSRVYK